MIGHQRLAKGWGGVLTLAGSLQKVRELVVYSYRLIYRLQDDEVVIAAVIHGKRMLTATEELGDNP